MARVVLTQCLYINADDVSLHQVFLYKEIYFMCGLHHYSADVAVLL